MKHLKGCQPNVSTFKYTYIYILHACTYVLSGLPVLTADSDGRGLESLEKMFSAVLITGCKSSAAHCLEIPDQEEHLEY